MIFYFIWVYVKQWEFKLWKKEIQMLIDKWRSTCHTMLIKRHDMRTEHYTCEEKWRNIQSYFRVFFNVVEKVVITKTHFHLRSLSIIEFQKMIKWEYVQVEPLPLHYAKIAVCCGFRTAFITTPSFSWKIGPSVPVTYTVNGPCYESVLRNQLIPVLHSANVCIP